MHKNNTQSFNKVININLPEENVAVKYINIRLFEAVRAILFYNGNGHPLIQASQEEQKNPFPFFTLPLTWLSNQIFAGGDGIGACFLINASVTLTKDKRYIYKLFNISNKGCPSKNASRVIYKTFLHF